MTRLDRILSGLKNTLQNTPGIIEKWDTLDTDLQIHYIDQISDFFSSHHFEAVVLKLAEEEGRQEEVTNVWLNGMTTFLPYASFFESKGAVFE